jgi:hypothetical protein
LIVSGIAIAAILYVLAVLVIGAGLLLFPLGSSDAEGERATADATDHALNH